MEKRLYKSGKNKVLCGVCGGIAEYFNIDPTLVRLGWIVFCALGGSGVLAYIIAAKSMAMTAIDLLADGAETALRIKRDFVPVYKDRDAWLAAWAELME